MIIIGDNLIGIHELKKYLHQNFEMKDLGPLNYFLGLEISYSSTDYYSTRAKYISDILIHANLTNCKISDKPT